MGAVHLGKIAFKVYKLLDSFICVYLCILPIVTEKSHIDVKDNPRCEPQHVEMPEDFVGCYSV